MQRPSLLCLLLVTTLACGDDAWRGVDLSYVNELEDCGAVYRRGEAAADPYQVLAEAGANIVRLRLWVDPDWTDYSTLADVSRSLRRAKAAGMQTMLDFHYSDDWAHPGKQLRPKSWPPADDVDGLVDALSDYTASTLEYLASKGLLPDVVAVGNETNTDMLIDAEVDEKAAIDWPRNVRILNAGIRAVRNLDVDEEVLPRVMLHIAQPENVEQWFDDGIAAGLEAFDVIGISYYPKWSSTPFADIGAAVGHFHDKYGADIVIVETAYPWTLEGNDEAGNILGEDSLVEGFPATPAGQRAFLLELRSRVTNAGGLGVVYWEPAWVSSSCSTRWGKGSHWENATLFDFDNRLLPGADYLAPASD